VLERSEEAWGVPLDRLRRWCGRNFGADFNMLYIVLSFALYVFPGNPGVWRAPGEVGRRCEGLTYDEDGLLTGSERGDLEFTKNGVLIGPYALHYSPMIRAYNLGLTGGLLDHLERRLRAPGDRPERFGLAVDPDLVLDRSFHLDGETKLFMRGPRGVPIERLRDPRFPEDPSGTVTEHIRLYVPPAQALLGPDIHSIQVMWSYRDGVKTVQMEELVSLDAKQFRRDARVANRYLHARWDVRTERFIHLDGAVKVYDKARYEVRVGTDLRDRRPEAEADDYHKLFRLDAPLELEEWSRLVACFYHENELAAEYLDGELGVEPKDGWTAAGGDDN
jgi:hypothetical protein